jgi:hypothetical protein
VDEEEDEEEDEVDEEGRWREGDVPNSRIPLERLRERIAFQKPIYRPRHRRRRSFFP